MRLNVKYKSFPDALRAVTTPALRANPKWRDNDTALVGRHNEVIDRFGNGFVHNYKGLEFQVLNLAKSIDEWTMTDAGQDGYGTPNVSVPMVQAFRAALNFDCGRLDCGVLDEWALSVFARLGVDEDGEWL